MQLKIRVRRKDPPETVSAHQGDALLQLAGQIRWDSILSRYGTVASLVFVAFAFAILSPQFLTTSNLISVAREVSTLSIVSAGLTICVAAGEFDLSIGSVASLAGILASGLMVNQHQGAVLAIAVALFAGLVAGVFNGLVVSRLRIPSLIATLGTAAIALGINYEYSNGDSIYGISDPTFSVLGQGTIGPIPISVVLAAAIFGAAYFFLNKTRPGRYILATGGNPTAARLSGISIGLYRLVSLIVAGICAALAGVVLTSYLGTGQPNGGDAYTLEALTAVFLGMTTIRPGQANIAGTVVGVLILGIVSNGLNLVGAPFYLQNDVQGLILIAAVALAVMREEIRFF